MQFSRDLSLRASIFVRRSTLNFMRFLGDQSGRARWQRLILAWALVFAPLLGWGTLAEDVWKRESFRYDDSILLWLHAHSNFWLNRLMLGLSLIGGYPLLFVSGALFLFFALTSRKHEAIFVAACIGGISALNIGAKMIFQRARPDLWISLAPEHDYSFPSGHAMLSSGFIAMILVLLWRATNSSTDARAWRIPSAIFGVAFVAAVGVSRLYLGVHYPSDILAGWLASCAWITLMRIVISK